MTQELVPLSPGEKPHIDVDAEQPAEPEVIISTDMHRKLEEFVRRTRLGDIAAGPNGRPRRKTQRNAFLEDI